MRLFYRYFIGFLICSLLQGIVSKAFANNPDDDMSKLVNYKKMNPKMQAIYKKQRQAQYLSWQKNQIPENFRIPPELQSYRTGNFTRYYALYSPAFKTGVGYIPSNLAQLYEEEAWQAFKQFGSNAPSLSIVLAQQFTESAFNPFAIGDKGKSIGLPQLYRQTAKFLFKTDKKTWEKLFYFNKNGKHIFKNTRMQVKFPFMFLPLVKQYTSQNKFDGVKRYNGSGDDAVKYAELVIKRSLFYEELFAKYNKTKLDTTNFKHNLFGIINYTLQWREFEPLSDMVLNQLFNNVIADFATGYVHNTYLNTQVVLTMESKPMQVATPQDYITPVDGKDYYLVIEDGFYLYDYFKDANVMLDIVNHPKNSDFYLYYKKGSKIVKITNYKGIGNKTVFANVKPGDKLYIPPGTVIYSTKSNIAVMMQ